MTENMNELVQVQVWVPKWLAPEIYRLAANPPAKGSVEVMEQKDIDEIAEPAEVAPGEIEVPKTREERRQAFWTKERVKTAYWESSQSMRVFMEILAASSGNAFYTDDLVEPMSKALEREVDWRAIGGMLGGFTRKMKRLLDVEKLETWPFHCQRDEDGRFYYIMGEWCAAWIIAFSSGDE